MSSPFIGQIVMFGGNFAPRSWAKCDGQLLAIAQNQALFSLLGTTYGGDGRTTFALPDLRGRVAMHAGNGPGLTPRPLGQRNGQERVTLTTLEMPQHNHLLTGSVDVDVADERADTHLANGNALAKNAVDIHGSGQTLEMYSDNPTFTGGRKLEGVKNSLTVGNNGGSQPHNNLQPYTVVNYIIALFGVFPSRN